MTAKGGIAGVVVAAALAGCQLVAPLPGDELCLVNADCGDPGQICRGGSCEAATDCTPRCGQEGFACGPDGCGGFCDRCGDGQVCEAGRCVDTCDGTCSGGRPCQDSGLCACRTGADCPAARPVCADSKTCVECVEGAGGDADPCGGLPCRHGVCQRCAGHPDCRGVPGRPWCDAGKCRPCAPGADGDAQCAMLGLGKACVDGLCVGCRREGAQNVGCEPDQACDLGPHTCFPSPECHDAVEPRPCTAGKVCDPDSRRCVNCLADTDCESLHCDAAATHDCVWPTCGTDSQCSAPTPICDGKCLHCSQTRGCPEGSQCVKNRCTDGRCIDANDCTDPARPVCDPARQRCVVCTGDGQCTAPKVCDTVLGLCVDCVPGAVPSDCPADDSCGPERKCREAQPLDVCAVDGQDCPGNDQLRCVMPTLAGADALTDLRGVCLEKTADPACQAGTRIEPEDGVAVCLPDCGGGGACPAGAFCAQSTFALGTTYCVPGCTAASCPAAYQCDPFWRTCRPVRPAAQAEGNCFATGCRPGEACMPVRKSGTTIGRCAPPCTTSTSACTCRFGVTTETGACLPVGPAGEGQPCVVDSDCVQGAVCAPEDPASGVWKCRAVCDRTTGQLLQPGKTCGGQCRDDGLGWVEPGHEWGWCQPEREIGKPCASDTECGTVAKCRWNAGGDGMCVAQISDTAACAAVCPPATTCGTGSDPLTGQTVCTKACTGVGECGPGLQCNSGRCTPACSTPGAPCPSAQTPYTCQFPPSGSLACLPAPAVEGTVCVAGATTCAAGTECKQGDDGVAWRCRRPCAAGALFCDGNAAMCMPSQYCAAPGAGGPGDACASLDECAPSLACAGTTCEPLCDKAQNPAVCYCGELGLPGYAGGVCGPPGWCVPPTSQPEVCDRCDQNNTGGADEGLGPVGGADLKVLRRDAGTDTQGVPLDAVLVELGAGQGFVALVATWHAGLGLVRLHGTRLVPGGSYYYVLADYPSTGKTLDPVGPSPVRRLAALAPIAEGTNPLLYFAYRFYAEDTIKLGRLNLAGGALALDGWSASQTTAWGPTKDPRLAAVPGRLMLAGRAVSATSSVFVTVYTPASGAELVGGALSITGGALAGHALVAHPGAEADFLHLRATAEPAVRAMPLAVIEQPAALIEEQGTLEKVISLQGTAGELRAAAIPGMVRAVALVSLPAGKTAALAYPPALDGVFTQTLQDASGPLAVAPLGDAGPFWALSRASDLVLAALPADLGVKAPRAPAAMAGGKTLGDVQRVELAGDGVRLGALGISDATGEVRFVSGCPPMP